MIIIMQATIISSWPQLYQEHKFFLDYLLGPTVYRAEREKNISILIKT